MKGVLLAVVWPALCRSVWATTHTHEWAVRFREGDKPFHEQAEDLAEAFDLINFGTVAGFEDVYSFLPRTACGVDEPLHCRARRDLTEPHERLTEQLTSHPYVSWAEQQKVLKRKRRQEGEPITAPVVFSDPLYGNQWHFHNEHHNDLRVQSVWDQGITGKGIVLTVVDDGFEHNHPDLADAYDPRASYDLNDDDDDPQPRYSPDNINKHGTRCAGEIAARVNNTVCGVGVAYDAKVGGVRIIDGDVTDSMEARALGLEPNYIDIYSSSWGPDDDGKTVDGPGHLAHAAIVRGIETGRGGKGSLYVFAGGNGQRRDNCNCDGYTNSIYTLSIGAVDHENGWPWYSEPCSATIAVTYSSGSDYTKGIVTTDLRLKCTDRHTGTSAAAPLAAGIFALLLQATPTLGWRDVQHLIIATSWKVAAEDPSWMTNGVGKWVSHQFGFGALDTARLVEASRHWSNVGAQQTFFSQDKISQKPITDDRPAVSTITLNESGDVNYLEHVTANVTINHQNRGDLEVFLVSPQGTRSQLLTVRYADKSQEGFYNWIFMTIFCWGESPIGQWKLEVRNGEQSGNRGKLIRWQLGLYGTAQPCDHAAMCSSPADVPWTPVITADATDIATTASMSSPSPATGQEQTNQPAPPTSNVLSPEGTMESSQLDVTNEPEKDWAGALIMVVGIGMVVLTVAITLWANERRKRSESYSDSLGLFEGGQNDMALASDTEQAEQTPFELSQRTGKRPGAPAATDSQSESSLVEVIGGQARQGPDMAESATDLVGHLVFSVDDED